MKSDIDSVQYIYAPSLPGIACHVYADFEVDFPEVVFRVFDRHR